MTASIQIAHLLTDVGASVDDARAHVGPIGELPGFIVNLSRRRARGGGGEGGT